MRSTSLLIALALSVVGCASSAATETAADELVPTAPTAHAARTPGSGTSEGVLSGTALRIADAVVLAGPLSEREPGRLGARIVLTTDDSACTRVDTVRAGGAAIRFDIEFVGGVLKPGTYSVPDAFGAGPDSVIAQLDSASAECRRKTVVPSVGTVTVATSEAGRISGTFEVTSGRDTMRGTFDAAPCSLATAPPLAVRCQR